MDYMMWLQESDSYDTFTSKAAAVAARVAVCANWRKGNHRTAIKHFVAGRWDEQCGYDLKDHGQVVGLVSVFPARDR